MSKELISKLFKNIIYILFIFAMIIILPYTKDLKVIKIILITMIIIHSILLLIENIIKNKNNFFDDIVVIILYIYSILIAYKFKTITNISLNEKYLKINLIIIIISLILLNISQIIRIITEKKYQLNN